MNIKKSGMGITWTLLSVDVFYTGAQTRWIAENTNKCGLSHNEIVSSSLFVFWRFTKQLSAYCHLPSWSVYTHGCLGTVRNNHAKCEVSHCHVKLLHSGQGFFIVTSWKKWCHDCKFFFTGASDDSVCQCLLNLTTAKPPSKIAVWWGKDPYCYSATLQMFSYASIHSQVTVWPRY